jgi:hypothetical protein
MLLSNYDITRWMIEWWCIKSAMIAQMEEWKEGVWIAIRGFG